MLKVSTMLVVSYSASMKLGGVSARCKFHQKGSEYTKIDNYVKHRGKNMARLPITNEQEHAAALEAIERLFEAEPGTPEGAELDELITLVEEYEDIHYPMP